jgi:hypothetical protein
VKIYEAWQELYEWLINLDQDVSLEPEEVLGKMDHLEEVHE